MNANIIIKMFQALSYWEVRGNIASLGFTQEHVTADIPSVKYVHGNIIVDIFLRAKHIGIFDTTTQTAKLLKWE